jgi:glutamyl-tRNA reductase
MITHTSIDYKSFSLEEREKYLASINHTIQRNNVVIATCNRVEIYQGSGEVDEQTVLHLFELTAGLKSRLIGETSIQGQVKEAYLKASRNTGFNKELHKLFQSAIHVGKKVRSTTLISHGAMSHSQATIQLIEKYAGNVRGLTFALFGVNNLNNNILQFLKKKGATGIFIGNRNLDKASQIAHKYGIEAFNYSQKKQIIEKADIVISATSAPHTIIHCGDITHGRKDLLVFDLAVPRDVEPTVGNISGVRLFNITQIENNIEENLTKRKQNIDAAKALVEEEVQKFLLAQKRKTEYETKSNKDIIAA